MLKRQFQIRARVMSLRTVFFLGEHRTVSEVLAIFDGLLLDCEQAIATLSGSVSALANAARFKVCMYIYMYY